MLRFYIGVYRVALTWSWASVKGWLGFDGVYSENTMAILKGVPLGLVDTRNNYHQGISAKVALEGQVLHLPAKSDQRKWASLPKPGTTRTAFASPQGIQRQVRPLSNAIWVDV